MTCSVAIIDTGVANIASITAAMERLGAIATLTADPADATSADHVILPGVGSFKAGMTRLQGLNLVAPLKARIERGDSTLAICLGFQMLCATSEESPGTSGIGAIQAKIQRFDASLPTPQLGWNTVSPSNGDLLTQGDAYFANSYCLRTPPAEWNCATTDFGAPFVSAIWRNNVLACQFHPELSGTWGQELLARWINLKSPSAKEATPC